MKLMLSKISVKTVRKNSVELEVWNLSKTYSNPIWNSFLYTFKI
jgi:hypothetical protein